MAKIETYTVDNFNEKYSTFRGNPEIQLLPGSKNKTGIEISTGGKTLGDFFHISQVSVAAPRDGEKDSTNNSYGTEKHYQVYYYDGEGEKHVSGMNGSSLITVTVQTSTGVPSPPSSASKSSSPLKSTSSSVSKSTSRSGSRSRSKSGSKSGSKSTSSGGRKKKRSSRENLQREEREDTNRFYMNFAFK
jgi:hypothetical protein